MKKLTKKQILMLHQDLLNRFGGTAGIRDEGLLESAISAPFQTFDGKALYPTILEKAARLGYGLIQNHPFVDGNKRIGIHAMLVFLALNGQEPAYQDEELISAALDIAAGKLEEKQLLEWLIRHCQ